MTNGKKVRLRINNNITTMTQYDIFISYRRESFNQANLICTRLKALGYRVFIDVEALNSGKFNEQLLAVIKNCKDFIVVLPPSALDRCVNTDDWVRREVMCAMENKKNIIPIMLAGFEWPNPMPEGMEELCMYQSLAPMPDVYFDMQIQKLQGYLKSKPHVKRRRTWLIVLGIIAAVVLCFWLVGTITFKPVARQTGEALSLQVDCVDQIMKIAQNIDKELSSSFQSMDLAVNEEDRDAIKRDFLRYLDSQEKQIQQVEAQRQAFGIPSSKTFLMSFHVSPVDFMIFEEGSKMFAEQIGGFYTGLIRQSFEDDDYSAMKRKLLSGELKSDNLLADGIYYAYAQMLSHLPEDAQQTFYELSPKWATLPKTSLNLSDKEYERLQEIGNEQISQMTSALRLYYERNEPVLGEMEQQLHDLEIKSQQLDSILNLVLEE